MSWLRCGALALGLVVAGQSFADTAPEATLIPWIDVDIVDGEAHLRAMVTATVETDLRSSFELLKEDDAGRVVTRQGRTTTVAPDAPTVLGETTVSLGAGGTLSARIVVTYGDSTAEAELTLTTGDAPLGEGVDL